MTIEMEDPRGKQVECSDCHAVYLCTPEHDYFRRNKDGAMVCFDCLLSSSGMDPATTRVVELCPVHGIPDCSPLLNGCTRLTDQRAYSAIEMAYVGQREFVVEIVFEQIRETALLRYYVDAEFHAKVQLARRLTADPSAPGVFPTTEMIVAAHVATASFDAAGKLVWP